MAFNCDNDRAEKRTHATATRPSSTRDDTKRECSSGDGQNGVHNVHDPANGPRIWDVENSMDCCYQSPGNTREQVIDPGNSVITESACPLAEVIRIDQNANRNGDHQDENHEQLKRMQGAVRILLECLGEDIDREGLHDTPSRYAKALLFMTKGYQVNATDVVNNAIFSQGHSGIVIVKEIEIFSLCEHHLVPFTGKVSNPVAEPGWNTRDLRIIADPKFKMHVGYVPSGTVIGLSKLARIAEVFSRRLQIQERLTNEIATAIMEILTPQGVAVVMECSHMCMVMRGVEKTTAKTLTSCMIGCFERNSETRNEFFNLVGFGR